MMKLFNKTILKEKRQALRNNATLSEKILWSKLKKGNPFNLKFRRQYSIGNYIVDFYCPELKLAIEIDGDSHFQEGADKKDFTRTNFLEREGINLIRFTNNDVKKNLQQVLEEINREVELLKQGSH
ncbi:MAG: endonuclease domain-containing protein [Bacteroidetes bacterium]|nr:endonuclease domain-containing protein [Bacteroidota bacterium]